RRALLGNEHAEGEGTVADGEEGPRNGIEKIDSSQQANRPNRQGNPAIPKEKPQRTPVDRKHPFFGATDDTLDPVLFRAPSAFLEQAGAHERCKCQRNDAAGKNRNDDGDRELSKDAPNQAAHKSKRKEYSG